MFLYEGPVLFPESDSPFHYLLLFLAFLSGLLDSHTHTFLFLMLKKNALYLQCSCFLSLLLAHRKVQKSFRNLSSIIPFLSNLVWSFVNKTLLKICGISTYQIEAHSIEAKMHQQFFLRSAFSHSGHFRLLWTMS